MQKLNRENVNTKEYWNGLYKDSFGGGWLQRSDFSQYLYPKIAEVYFPGLKIIEIGGGDGTDINLLTNIFPVLEIWNLDLSDVAINRGKGAYPHITQVCHDIMKPVTDIKTKFNILFCQEVIEHLCDPIIGISNMMNILTNNALAIFTFPYNEGYTGGFEHIWSFNYDSINELFFPYSDEVTIYKFCPGAGSLHGCVIFQYNGVVK